LCKRPLDSSYQGDHRRPGLDIRAPSNELEEGNQLPGTYPAKERAVAAGRDKAKSDKTEHVIHKQNGQIENRNSYGNDASGRG
jgi:hypothetical protein